MRTSLWSRQRLNFSPVFEDVCPGNNHLKETLSLLRPNCVLSEKGKSQEHYSWVFRFIFNSSVSDSPSCPKPGIYEEAWISPEQVVFPVSGCSAVLTGRVGMWTCLFIASQPVLLFAVLCGSSLSLLLCFKGITVRCFSGVPQRGLVQDLSLVLRFQLSSYGPCLFETFPVHRRNSVMARSGVLIMYGLQWFSDIMG